MHNLQPPKKSIKVKIPQGEIYRRKETENSSQRKLARNTIIFFFS